MDTAGQRNWGGERRANADEDCHSVSLPVDPSINQPAIWVKLIGCRCKSVQGGIIFLVNGTKKVIWLKESSRSGSEVAVKIHIKGPVCRKYWVLSFLSTQQILTLWDGGRTGIQSSSIGVWWVGRLRPSQLLKQIRTTQTTVHLYWPSKLTDLQWYQYEHNKILTSTLNRLYKEIVQWTKDGRRMISMPALTLSIIRQDRSILNRFCHYEYLSISLELMLPCMKMILISLCCGWFKCFTQQNLIYCRWVFAVKQLNVAKFSISQSWDWDLARLWNALVSYSLAVLECMSLTPSTHLMFKMFTSPVQCLMIQQPTRSPE